MSALVLAASLLVLVVYVVLSPTQPTLGGRYVKWTITTNVGFLENLQTTPRQIRIVRGREVEASAHCALLVNVAPGNFTVRARAWHTALPIVLYDNTVEACEGLHQLQAYLDGQGYGATIPQCPLRENQLHTASVKVPRLTRWLPPGTYRLDLVVHSDDHKAAFRKEVFHKEDFHKEVFALEAFIPVN